MVIDIRNHYFGNNINGGEVKRLGNFQIGEIVTDWNGDVGCILMLFKNGEVRTDSNGMGDISKLKKVRSSKKILAYLQNLHNVDRMFMQDKHNFELRQVIH